MKIISHLGLWMNTPAKSWNRMLLICRTFEDGYKAAKQAEEIGRIYNLSGLYFPFEQYQLNKLTNRLMDFKSFVEGIHYEIAEKIDIPFTLALESILDDCQNLNPNDFRTESPLFGFINRGQDFVTLFEELALYTDLNLSELCNNLLKQREELIDDKPYKELTDVFEEAKYWQKEFNKARKIQELTKDFIKRNGENWNNLIELEKTKLLEEYCKDIASTLDEKKWYEITRGNKLSVKLKWTSEPGSDDNCTLDVYSTPGPLRYIYLTKKYKEEEISTDELEYALNSIVHAIRHNFQEAAFDDPKRYDIPLNIINNWSEKIPDYGISSIEIDARAFAVIASTVS